VDRPPLGVLRDRVALVDRLPDHVPEPTERRLSDGDGDGRAGVEHVDAAGKAVGRIHGDRADAVVAQVLLHFCDERAGRRLDLEGGQDLGKAIREDGVDHDALDLDDLPQVATGRARLRHVAPMGVS
jgi:hypothetical protein